MILSDITLVDWSRAQFALTAMYHWLFVPLTLGLSFIIAVMETIYVKTGNEEWKKAVKFWMVLFGINYVIGAATGIILEFEFGTNWANYSWIVGDIFGAPLAIEGIMAFFLESTFIVLMFFGWNKVGKKTHLLATWLVAAGSNLSAWWILVANAWMNNPVGVDFNPDTARCEMVSFFDIAFSPFAVSKFFHTVTSGYVVASLFVAGISSWYLLRSRHILFAKRSLWVAAIFGLFSSVLIAFSGDLSAYQVAQKQPMKLAAMEGLYKGQTSAPLVVLGYLNNEKTPGDTARPFRFKVEIPSLLSFLAYRNTGAFVPGIEDLLYGNYRYGIEPVTKIMERGKNAIIALSRYKESKNNEEQKQAALSEFKECYGDIGYGYLEKPEDIVPNVHILFNSFHTMVFLGFFFIALFLAILVFKFRKNIEKQRWLLVVAIISVPLGYYASELGWILAEMGRQPWAIQDILPVSKATSNLNTSDVKITFTIFAVLFTLLLFAEIKIMIKQIKTGPKE